MHISVPTSREITYLMGKKKTSRYLQFQKCSLSRFSHLFADRSNRDCSEYNENFTTILTCHAATLSLLHHIRIKGDNSDLVCICPQSINANELSFLQIVFFLIYRFINQDRLRELEREKRKEEERQREQRKPRKREPTPIQKWTKEFGGDERAARMAETLERLRLAYEEGLKLVREEEQYDQE